MSPCLFWLSVSVPCIFFVGPPRQPAVEEVLLGGWVGVESIDLAKEVLLSF